MRPRELELSSFRKLTIGLFFHEVVIKQKNPHGLPEIEVGVPLYYKVNWDTASMVMDGNVRLGCQVPWDQPVVGYELEFDVLQAWGTEEGTPITCHNQLFYHAGHIYQFDAGGAYGRALGDNSMLKFDPVAPIRTIKP